MLFNFPLSSPQNRGLLSFTYLFYFAQIGVFVSYVSVFLDDKGFSSQQIGTLFATVAVARIIGPNLWAGVADRTGKVGLVMRIGSLLSLSTFLFIFIAESYLVIVLIFSVMMMFWTAIIPQLEVTAVNACGTSKGGYGAIRMWGSIGFILATIIVGALLDVFSSQAVIISATFTLFGIFICTLLITAPKKANAIHHEGGSIVPEVLTKGFIAFIVANTLLQVSFGSFYSFFTLYMRQLDYQGWQTGIFMAVGVVAEIVIFVFAARLIKRFSISGLFVFSLAMTAVRWLMLAFLAHSWWFILLSQLMHAFSFGLTHSVSIHYLHKRFSERYHSRAQAIYVSICFGLGTAIGSYFAGIWWSDGIGAVSSYVYCALIAIVATFAALFITDDKTLKHDEKVSLKEV